MITAEIKKTFTIQLYVYIYSSLGFFNNVQSAVRLHSVTWNEAIIMSEGLKRTGEAKVQPYFITMASSKNSWEKM